MQDEPRHFVATKNKVLKQQWGFPGGASGKKKTHLAMQEI